LRGLIAALRLIGSMTGDVFEAYIEQFVGPELRPGDVVVVDNLSAHKRAAVGALVENAKASICFLPPYPPDLSPNEPCSSKVKHIIRSLQARTLEALELAIVQGLRAVTCSDARGWFRLCGYRGTWEEREFLFACSSSAPTHFVESATSWTSRINLESGHGSRHRRESAPRAVIHDCPGQRISRPGHPVRRRLLVYGLASAKQARSLPWQRSWGFGGLRGPDGGKGPASRDDAGP